MPDDGYEANRVFGMPRGTDPHARQGGESQRVLGVPANWFGPVDDELVRSLRHPIRAYRRWKLHRRLGPYAPDEDKTD